MTPDSQAPFRRKKRARLAETVAYAVFSVIGFFSIIYDLAGGGASASDFGAFGMACLAWAKAFEVGLRLRDHQEGKDDA